MWILRVHTKAQVIKICLPGPINGDTTAHYGERILMERNQEYEIARAT